MNLNEEKIIHINSFITASQIAKILNISRAKAYQLLQTNKIRNIKIGKSRRVRQQDLDNYIYENLSPGIS